MTTSHTNHAYSLGEFLRVHRQGEEMSQVEFAKQLGVSKQRLCDIEHNRFAVSIKLAKRIAKTMKLPPEWLVKLALQDQIKKEKLNLKVS
jgi:DNA-binding XRE family transcriptional regulator